MNRDEESNQLPHIYDYLLSATATPGGQSFRRRHCWFCLLDIVDNLLGGQVPEFDVGVPASSHQCLIIIQWAHAPDPALCFKKNIPNIFDCILKKTCQILTILGANIPDTTCRKMTIQFPTSPMSATALPTEIRPNKICLEMTKKCEKNTPDIIICNWNKTNTS